ncbi:oxygenase MpaB family protein [Pseudarthrobacter sp. NamE5]|uniref:oxygenase MpaB family protein n=1 Tax=Pseudarthrobacter sp. NamE5 TaxID=2576839 RepID=UPI00110BB5AF|nr:oxygenase MpaB family protein [Pseudarthrobacter sp. NamE5]TLM87131.1 DUF2236 domain-containing protein [Pseudarthrobacter sp. NamE5]
MKSILSPVKRRLIRTFSNGSEGVPQWQLDLAEGGDPGYHLPGSAVWAVHGSMSPIVAGIRTLLMQSLHPGALAGVHEHSNFREDPLGRLANTIRWIFTVTYGSTEAAGKASRRVRQLHETVRGTYSDNSGAERAYSANDPELASWIHLTFTDAFLTAHKLWGGSIPGGPNAYVREWAHAGRLMGVEDPPLTEEDMHRQLDRWYDSGELRVDARVAETVEFIRNPPLNRMLRPGYRVLFAGAVYSLEPRYRRMLGLSVPRLGPVALPVRSATKLVLGVVRLALGRRGPSELAARERLRRLGVPATDI